jgi:hypothetical protein
MNHNYIKELFKKIIKKASIIFFLLLIVAAGVCIISNSAPADLGAKSFELKSYCRTRGYNTDYGILVDYSRHSFQQRLYVVDLNTGKIVLRSLCGHGRGGNSSIFRGEFSNVSGSHCSSLGHYKIGRERKMYNYPILDAFELDGLDKTNSNARARAILIHPSFGPRSLGCVTLPFIAYKRVSKILHSQRGKVIMWAYN